MSSCYRKYHLLTCAISGCFLKALNDLCGILFKSTEVICYSQCSPISSCCLSLPLRRFLSSWTCTRTERMYLSFSLSVIFVSTFTVQWEFVRREEPTFLCNNWGITADWWRYLIPFHITEWINTWKHSEMRRKQTVDRRIRQYYLLWLYPLTPAERGL